ncbi:hypothetical protein [Streptomyces chiangmaiensis]|uniref:YokE-like PH domain-containing protein n=1 Tax=Streptomyces chiangmaiensis TaxID=766497 RepID=A0ABU7FXF3_9ACTN|nr:hypothetical protein [Streptomyces chiangmaiensis]MED7828503.1 hypothetical protein [Streptomyces chiangmaiensis]
MQSRLLERLIKRSLKKAFRRAERQLKPLIEPGETLLSSDMCQAGAHLLEIYTVRSPATFVVVSTKAVYLLQRGRGPLRIPAYAIADVQLKELPDPLVTIRLRDGQVIGLLAHGGKPAAFGPDLKALVPARSRRARQRPPSESG